MLKQSDLLLWKKLKKVLRLNNMILIFVFIGLLVVKALGIADLSLWLVFAPLIILAVIRIFIYIFFSLVFGKVVKHKGRR